MITIPAVWATVPTNDGEMTGSSMRAAAVPLPSRKLSVFLNTAPLAF